MTWKLIHMYLVLFTYQISCA